MAREAAADDVDAAAPRAPVERAHVVEDREALERAFVLPRAQHLLAERLDFDGADGAPAEQLSAEDAAADAGEKRELAQRLAAAGAEDVIVFIFSIHVFFSMRFFFQVEEGGGVCADSGASAFFVAGARAASEAARAAEASTESHTFRAPM